MDNLRTLFHTLLPSSPAFYFAVEFPSTMTILTSIVLPVIFFLVSKTVDVLVRVYFENRKKTP